MTPPETCGYCGHPRALHLEKEDPKEFTFCKCVDEKKERCDCPGYYEKTMEEEAEED